MLKIKCKGTFFLQIKQAPLFLRCLWN